MGYSNIVNLRSARGLLLGASALLAPQLMAQSATVEVIGYVDTVPYSAIMYGAGGSGGSFAANDAAAPETSPLTSGGPNLGPNDKDPNEAAKPCAQLKILEFTGSGTASLTTMMNERIVPVFRGSAGMDVATVRRIFPEITNDAWNLMGEGGRRFHQLQPAYVPQVGIYIPTDASGRPMILSDPQACAYFQTHCVFPNGSPVNYGSYGPTWLGLVNMLGMQTLASRFAATGSGEALAREFIFQHEIAHGQTPNFSSHPQIRNESTFFTANGTPATQDGLALLNMAAVRANQPDGGTFTRELDRLKSMGVPIPSACYPSDPNC